MTLFRQGFPCAELLAGPEPFGDLVATAESYIPRGEQPPSPPPAGPCASRLAALVAMTPPPALYPALAGAPPWVAWDHAGPGLWPPPDDLALDLNERSSPDGLDAYAERIRARLRGVSGRHVIGHIDWEARNLEWHGGEPVAVHDWDSLAIRPEATVAGVAAVVYPSFSEVVAAEIDQTDTFLAAYGERRSL